MLIEKNINEGLITKYELGYIDMMYEETIKPFLESMSQLFLNILPKMAIAVIGVMVALLELGQSLFQSPSNWVLGISILVFLDFLSGTFRALSTPEIEFSFKRWIRTAFKIGSYSIALAAVIVASNMFPHAMGWLQYVTFALLTANEIYSILRNLKLTALADVLWDIMVKKGVAPGGLQGIWSEVDKRALDKIKMAQEKKYTRYIIKEELAKIKKEED